jgi:uncharacterized damage-inducible protein DinB
MSRVTQLAKHLERTVTGPMWHGPALANVLEAVPHDKAAARPIPGAHSIWEIVLHVTTWAQIARERLKGDSTGDPTAERDWPSVPESDPKSGSDPASDPDLHQWRLAIEQLGFAHRMLAADVRELTDDSLDAMVPGLEYSVWILLHGIVEHGIYHAGQIALLKRALEGGRP